MRSAPILLVCLLAVPALPAAAHGVQVDAELVPPAVVVSARYEGGPPLADASVRIYTAEDEAPLFQRARTDAAGRCAFLPASVGTWKVVVADAQGHRTSLEIEVDEAFLAGATSSQGRASTLPLFARWMLGLAIIVGVTGLAFWGKARALLREREGRP